MCEIFNYLSFETLYFSLRKVCMNIQTYVNRYLNVRGTSFLVDGQKGSEKQVIEIIQKPGKGLIIFRTLLSSTPCVTSKLLFNESFDEHRDRRIDKVLYAAIRESQVCYKYKSKGVTYGYDLESDKWKNFLENFTTLRCLDHDELSHECIQSIVSEDFPYYFEYDNYGHFNYPIVQVKAIDKPVRVCKVFSCKYSAYTCKFLQF